jgi:hypothetical protein
VNDAAHEELLGSHGRETLAQVEPHLAAKDADLISPGTVGFFDTVVFYILE